MVALSGGVPNNRYVAGFTVEFGRDCSLFNMDQANVFIISSFLASSRSASSPCVKTGRTSRSPLFMNDLSPYSINTMETLSK